MKFKFHIPMLLSLSVNALAFEPAKIDIAVSSFLHKRFADECSDIQYSFLFALTVEEAYRRGFYRINPYKGVEPRLPSDVFINFKTDMCDIPIIGYGMTLREEEGEYKVLGYSAFGQPE